MVNSRWNIVWIFAVAVGLGACQQADFGSGGGAGQQDSPGGEDGSGDSDASEELNNGQDADGRRSGEQGDPSIRTGGEENGGDGSLGDGGDDASGEKRDLLFRPDDNTKVDLIFLFDTSPSMDDFVNAVQTRMEGFINQWLADKDNLDYQILVVGEVDPTVSDARVGYYREYVGSHSALGRAKEVLTSGQKYGSVQLRPKSVKQLVVISNDDSSANAQAFKAWVEQNKKLVGRVHVNGFVGFDESSFFSDCYIDGKGQTYMTLGNDAETKGLVQDLCSSDWNRLIENLGKRVARTVSSTFKLDDPPDDPDRIQVRVNGNETEEFYYDGDDQTVTVEDELEAGDKVEISY